MAALSSQQILRKAFSRHKKKNSSYSMRRLAGQLAISPAFMHDIFSGKKALPAKYISRLERFLNLDQLATERLKLALLKEHTSSELHSSFAKPTKVLEKMREEDVVAGQYHLLHRWYFLSMLDLTTCKGFSDDPQWLGRRLGINSTDAREAWEFLVRSGHVTRSPKGWMKCAENIRFPTRSSESTVRDYHAQALRLAQRELEKSRQADFAQRLISGASIAVNPAKIEEAKLRLQTAIVEACQILSEGECSEVFQLQVQLFPVTKESK